MYLLFKGILDNTIKTDEEAAKLIYDTDKSDKRYLMLKKNLNKRLTRFILTSTPIEFDTELYTNISFECQQEIVVVKLLLNNNIYHNAEKVLWRVIRKAEKFELNNILLDCYQCLTRIYSIQGEVSQLEQAQEKVEHYQHKHNCEQKYLRHLELLQAMNKWNKGYSFELASQAMSFTKSIKKSCEVKSSIHCTYYYESINVYAAYHQTDIDALEQHLKNIKTIFEENHFMAIPEHQLIYYLFSLRCSLMKGDISNAFLLLEQCLELTDYDAFNKYEVQDLHFELLLKTGDYEKALEVLNEVYATDHFSMLSPKDQSAWGLRKTYLHIFSDLEFSDEEIQNAINIDQLTENCKPNNKDKRGYNLQLTIISYLVRSIFTEEELDGNSLKMYIQRYLKQSSDQRSLVFLRYVIKYFQRKKSDKDSLLFMQEQFEREMPNGYSIVELFPYEYLFDYLLFPKEKENLLTT
ncbi:hypothetical protein [Sediminitomix flava]|nr:hypothetical protein [Sediminitomix flava]